jgi:hypothetical protein
MKQNENIVKLAFYRLKWSLNVWFKFDMLIDYLKINWNVEYFRTYENYITTSDHVPFIAINVPYQSSISGVVSENVSDGVLAKISNAFDVAEASQDLVLGRGRHRFGRGWGRSQVAYRRRKVGWVRRQICGWHFFQNECSNLGFSKVKNLAEKVFPQLSVLHSDTQRGLHFTTTIL